jgi:nucleotide-binding universal stress UspA family protein
MKRILLPIDIRLFSFEAVQLAVEIAKSKNSTIVFLFVANNKKQNETLSLSGNLNSSFDQMSQEDYQTAKSIVTGQGIKVEEFYCNDDNFNCVSLYVENYQADLIVLANKQSIDPSIGKIISTYASRVIETSPIPIVIVEEELIKAEVNNALHEKRMSATESEYVYLNSSLDYSKQNTMLLHYKSLYSLYVYMPMMRCINDFARQNVLSRMFSILELRQIA